MTYFSSNKKFHLIPWPQKPLKSGIIYYFDIFRFFSKFNHLAYFFRPLGRRSPAVQRVTHLKWFWDPMTLLKNIVQKTLGGELIFPGTCPIWQMGSALLYMCIQDFMTVSLLESAFHILLNTFIQINPLIISPFFLGLLSFQLPFLIHLLNWGGTVTNPFLIKSKTRICFHGNSSNF